MIDKDIINGVRFCPTTVVNVVNLCLGISINLMIYATKLIKNPPAGEISKFIKIFCFFV